MEDIQLQRPFRNRTPPQPKLFIYQLPYKDHKEIEDLLNINDNWEQLAVRHLNISITQMEKIRRRNQMPDESAAKALLAFMEQRNTKITDLYTYLNSIQLYRGMDILTKYIPAEKRIKYKSQPILPSSFNSSGLQGPYGNLIGEEFTLPVKIEKGYYDPPDETRSHNLTTSGGRPAEAPRGSPSKCPPNLQRRQNVKQKDEVPYAAPCASEVNPLSSPTHVGIYANHNGPRGISQSPVITTSSQVPPYTNQSVQSKSNQSAASANPSATSCTNRNIPNNQPIVSKIPARATGNVNIVKPNISPSGQASLVAQGSPLCPPVSSSPTGYTPGSASPQLNQVSDYQHIVFNKRQTEMTVRELPLLRHRNISECTNISSISNASSTAGGVPRVSFDSLAAACDNWSPRLKIGEGGYGEVYRAIWQHQDVAIKRLRRDKFSNQDESQYRKCIEQCLQEINYLNRLRSHFLLPILAYADIPEPCIVYQFMPKGSLADRLKRRKGELALTWQERFQIAVGIANGLQFLHSNTKGEKQIIHGDIKSANILLDQNLEPKIGDFGLAQEVDFNESKIVLTSIYGTKFYLPNDFFRDRQLSTKVDTYSYGIILFDLVTGKQPNYRDRESQTYLVDIMKEEDTKLSRWVDKSWPEFFTDIKLSAVLYHFGLCCAHDKKKHRPEMEEVYVKLKEVARSGKTGSPSPFELQMTYDSQDGTRKSVDSEQHLERYLAGHLAHLRDKVTLGPVKPDPRPPPQQIPIGSQHGHPGLAGCQPGQQRVLPGDNPPHQRQLSQDGSSNPTTARAQQQPSQFAHVQHAGQLPLVHHQGKVYLVNQAGQLVQVQLAGQPQTSPSSAGHAGPGTVAAGQASLSAAADIAAIRAGLTRIAKRGHTSLLDQPLTFSQPHCPPLIPPPIITLTDSSAQIAIGPTPTNQLSGSVMSSSELAEGSLPAFSVLLASAAQNTAINAATAPPAQIAIGRAPNVGADAYSSSHIPVLSALVSGVSPSQPNSSGHLPALSALASGGGGGTQSEANSSGQLPAFSALVSDAKSEPTESTGQLPVFSALVSGPDSELVSSGQLPALSALNTVGQTPSEPIIKGDQSRVVKMAAQCNLKDNNIRNIEKEDNSLPNFSQLISSQVSSNDRHAVNAQAPTGLVGDTTVTIRTTEASTEKKPPSNSSQPASTSGQRTEMRSEASQSVRMDDRHQMAAGANSQPVTGYPQPKSQLSTDDRLENIENLVENASDILDSFFF